MTCIHGYCFDLRTNGTIYKMYRILAILVLVGSAHAQADANGGDLESIINSIFTQPTQAPAVVNPVTVPATTTTTKKPTIVERGPSTIVPPANTNDTTSCMTEAGKEGVCVEYYLCNKNEMVITDGTDIIDIRFHQDKCTSYMDVCCMVGDQRPPTDPITPKPDLEKEKRVGCGWVNPEGVGFKTTGERDGETKFGEFPWMVAILKVEPVNNDDPDGLKLNVYVGGGSLIHPSAVLTAAHNVAKTQELRARAGEWDTQNIKEIFPYQDREVESVVVHKDFNGGNLFYDVGILFLKSPMELTPNVGLACLPPYEEKAKNGARCFATGWGKDKFEKEGRYQVILKKVEVPAVDRNTCQDRLRTTRLGRLFQLHSSFMCAGGEPGKDTCKGDGGSPLVCPMEFEKDRYVQNGIVAWGIGCGEMGIPGVYVDVSKMRNWIDDKIAGKGLEPEVYAY